MKQNLLPLFLLLTAAIFLPFPAGLSAQETTALPGEDQEAAEAFLQEVYSRYALPCRKRLESFEIKLTFRRSEDTRLEWITDSLFVGYCWKSPDEESLDVQGVPKNLHGLIAAPLRGLWKDIAAGCVFAGLDERLLSLRAEEEKIVLSITREGGDSAEHTLEERIIFEQGTFLVLAMETSAQTAPIVVEPSYRINDDGLLRLEEKRVSLPRETDEGGRTGAIYTYSGFKDFGCCALPTKLDLEIDDNRMELLIEYTTINGRKAQPVAADIKKVKALVKEFEKGYSKWHADGKRAFMKKLEETGHELAAEAIARKGLKDKDFAIRAEAARTLGAMRCRKAVKPLTRAMKPNARHLNVYLALIKALGDIGDPKAIPFLSKDFWNQKEGLDGIRAAQAKINAMGNIRSKKAVDALIDMLYVADPFSMTAIAIQLQGALKKLTGQSFGIDRAAWRSWWKKNEKKFKLDED